MSYFATETEKDDGMSFGTLVASEVPRKVNQLLAQEVVKIFPDTQEHPNDGIIQTTLIRPLEATWGASEVFRVLQSNPTVSNFCGKVFKNGEPAIFCKDCQTDPTCCLCLECFNQSEHKNHNYKMFASGGGGCCDCGDLEAWVDHVYCSIHKPQEVETNQSDPISNLPSPLIECTKSFLSTILWYCMTVVNWEEARSVPPNLTTPDTQTLLTQDTFMAFLMNDEIHTYDEVILGLHRHIGMSHTSSTDLATYVDRKGRGILMKGSEQECLTAQTNVNKSLRHHPLGVKMYHSVLVRHQNCAVYLLNYLKELAEKSEGFSRLIAMVVVEPCLSSNNQCLLDRYFLTDNSLWIEVRLSWSRLIMSSIFKDFEYKRQLAVSLAKNYPKLSKNFVADSHDHDVCAMNLTVQLFTVPSLSRMLVLEQNLLEQVVSTIGDIVAPLYDGNKECLSLHSKDYKHERIVYLLYDLRYVLRNCPEDWTDQLRVRSRDGASVFLNLLSSMENMDAVKRQTGVHVEQEPRWENSFNFSIILMRAIDLFIQWCTSDQKVFLDTVQLALKRFISMSSKVSFRQHAVDASIIGRRSQELVTFNILKDKVSFHHPLPRFIAGLLARGSNKYNLSIPDVLRIATNEVKVVLTLMEPCSQSVVLSAQVLAGMWKRNGYGILNQALHYQLHLSRGAMYDKDIMLLQSMSSVLDHNIFLYALLYKYRLEQWFTRPSNGTTDWKEWREDAPRFLITELEEFMFLIIVLFGERHQSGIGEGMTTLDPMRHELIHLLYLSPLPHSQIMKKFKMAEDDNSVNKLIKEIAVLKRVSGKSVFELKDEHMETYDPFYYHYSKVEQSKSEEVWRKRMKSFGRNYKPPPSPPCLPPPFTPPYQGILSLGHSPVMLKILYNIFTEADSKDSKLWSVKLLHQALHLSALLIAEEHRLEVNTFARLCLGMDGSKYNLLPLMERLQSSPKVEERQHLLVWVIQQLQEVRNEATGCTTPLTTPTKEVVDETDSGTPSRKQTIAEEHRKRMMTQIAEMQKKFYNEHKEELEMIDNTGIPNRENSVTSRTGEVLLCAVGVSALLKQTHHPMSTACILCLESSDNSATETDKNFVLSACVQRSSVLRRQGQKIDNDLDFLNGRLDSKWGIFTGGCGHIMHAKCWSKYLDDKQAEHRRRFFFPIPGHTVHWQDGEFLCPLCQTFGNTVLPFVLRRPPCSQSFSPACSLTLGATRKMIENMVEIGNSVTEGAMMECTGSVCDEFTRTVHRLFPAAQFILQPVAFVKVSKSDREYVFAQQTFMQGYAQHPDFSSEKTPIAVWKNCLYTISGLENSMRDEGKFLLDSLSSRQMDSIYSLVELSGKISNNLKTTTLSEFANNLTINLLPKCSAFSDHPSVLDMDVFTLVGNLRFVLSALIGRLTATHSSSEDNPYLLTLIGHVDTCIVTVATSALIIQYLLCLSPGMDTDTAQEVGEDNDRMQVDGEDSSPELKEGHLLQKLWTQLRAFALNQLGPSSATGDTSPSPYSLFVGMREHLYPFLQCAALFYHSITRTEFVHSSASEASTFHDLCKYLGLPKSLPSLFEDPCILEITKNFCSHPKVSDLVRGTESVNSLLLFKPTRRLVTLPESYSDLISMASQFRCPRLRELGVGGEDTQTPMMCLLCGDMICSNSYCCRKSVEEDETVKIGGLTQHSLSCGGGFGVALWILESYVVLLNATDLHRVRGCTVTPPYIDEYGELDPGLRRGNPLKLSTEHYSQLQKYWLNHQLPGKICKEMEDNLRLANMNWAYM